MDTNTDIEIYTRTEEIGVDEDTFLDNVEHQIIVSEMFDKEERDLLLQTLLISLEESEGFYKKKKEKIGSIQDKIFLGITSAFSENPINLQARPRVELNEENIVKLLYLTRNFTNIEDIITYDYIFDISLEDIISKKRYFDFIGIDVNNILKYHPTFWAMDYEQIEGIIEEDRKVDPLTQQHKEKIEELNGRIVDSLNKRDIRIINEDGVVNLTKFRLKLLSYDEETLLFQGLDSLKRSFRNISETYPLRKEIERIILLHNIGIVKSITNKFLSKISSKKGSFEDYFGYGFVGLKRGLDKFEYERGYRFSTSATYWIYQGISRAHDDLSNPIRIPVHFKTDIRNYYKAIESFNNENRRYPNEDEIMSVLKISKVKLRNIENTLPLLRTKSLDDLLFVSDNNKRERSKNFHTTISHKMKSVEEIVEKNINRELLEEGMDGLNERERRILFMRYGLEGENDLTMQEVANRFGISKERVNQIESNAKKKVLNYLTGKKMKKEDI